MINIKCFGKRKEGTTSSTSSGASGTSGGISRINGVYLWGQYHDHTNDVNGDIVTSGGVNAQGNITTQGSITSLGNITSQEGDFSGGNMTLTGSITCDDITCDDINSGGDIRTTDLHCANINCTGDIETNKIEANTGTITNLVAEYLTVTKQAHFFELIIDKIKSNAGQVILSAANAIIDEVKPVTGGYKLYWRCKDTDTNKQISNDFALNDQIRCQTFNVHEGTNFNVANKYYWRLVTDTGTETITLDDEQVECNYIVVSDTDKDGTSIPEVGDEIVQLGNRTDTSRQNAIILSAVTSPDPNVTAPSIVQYKGINSYSLNNRILNQIAANGNTFTGNFMVVNGNTVDNVLNLITGTQPTIQTDTEASFLMVTSSYELNTIDDAQNLPTNIKLYDGSNLINYSNWTTNSYITDGITQVALKPAATHTGNGLYISEISSDGSGGCDVEWNFTQNYDVYSNYQIEIYIEWTDNGNTYHTVKTVPVNVIVQTASVPGSDAEFDRLQILTGDATVGVNDTLSVAFTAQVQHIKGNVITQQTNLSNYSMDVIYNNNGGAYTATKDTANNRFVYTDTVTDFSAEPTIPTNITFMLIYRSGMQNDLIDTYTIPIKFNAGSIFEVKNDAITAAVSASNDYTDAEIAVVNLTAQGLTSRVTNIENDYVTQSVLTQTADNISLNVYDELRNNTGIDVQAGTITLNANNTTINGNLNLNNTDNGIIVYDNDGTARIQIQPKEIGNFADFDGGSEYYIRTSITTSNQQSYSLSTDKKKIGAFNANDTLTMKNIKCFIKSWNGQNTQVPTPSSLSVAIKLYKEGNNTAVQTYNKTFNYNGTTNEFSTSDITYTVPSNGVYLFNATFTYNQTPLLNIYEEVYAVIEQTVLHQTYIGSDGMYCNPYHDAMFWAGSDGIIMRWANDGIRVDNATLKRTPYHYIVDQNAPEPEWLPFDNYVRVKTLDQNQFALYNNRYVYSIQPGYDAGVIASICPSFSTSGTATHITLPSYQYYDTGNPHILPVGYKVTIINTTASEQGGSSLSSNQYIYVDGGGNSWTVGKTMRTFIHYGSGFWAAS